MLFGVWFFVFGAICLAVGIFLLVEWVDFSKSALSTDGVIVDISRHYDHKRKEVEHDVTVEYIVDGIRYVRPLGYYYSSMEVGQTVTVNYDPEDPDHIMSSPYLPLGLLAVFFLVFGGIGAGFIIAEITNIKTINRLAEEEKYIICDNMTERVEVDANVKVNHVYYKQMNFIYRDQYGREYVFSSRPYHPDKNPFLDGKSVTVYVDIENNPKKYYLSIEE